MADNFEQHALELPSPGVRHHRPDFSTTDADLPFTARFFTASAAGTLVVDLPDSTQVTIQVFAGRNDLRISKIYTTGSDALTVDAYE